MSYLLVLTAVANLKQAQNLSQCLFKNRLCACVQIAGPVESHYLWKGKKAKAKEFQLWIKTKTTLYTRLEKAIRANHPYEVPEIIAVPIRKGSRDYLNWISKSVTRSH